ncbi:tetratricopeptide repeat protein [Massilia sp. MB5]|uniref:tetratricopeptide repeat protein n=1 Tax=unclassified Massilia TaxID=2609279 RepID=UPI00067C508B|nr:MULTISPECIES: tetratricopeptide repeat protein [unclassified Massilia]AKU23085.1 hypothetical protein ACZ75_18160 [Massilia sp. NR 4-1]UMR32031.1 tetratricopeptide repeat protein [Massilia sp. MB5]
MKIKAALAAATLLAASGPLAAKPFCGELVNAFGPFDYRTPDAEQLHLVEQAHFTEEVEQGLKGNTGTLGADLDYTLRAFPNHTRALETLAKVALRQKAVQLPGGKYPVECYFERAVRFVPDDGAAHAAYAGYLYRIGQPEKALPMLEKAVELDPENPSINYNLGLAYAKMKKYDPAVKYARKAYELGFPLPGLKNMLTAAGKWSDKTP